MTMERPKGAEKFLVVTQFESYLHLSLALDSNIRKGSLCEGE